MGHKILFFICFEPLKNEKPFYFLILHGGYVFIDCRGRGKWGKGGEREREGDINRLPHIGTLTGGFNLKPRYVS